jgi:hypothetical protein
MTMLPYNFANSYNLLTVFQFLVVASTLSSFSNALLFIGALPTQFFEVDPQVCHADVFLSAYINASEQSNIGFHGW